MNTLKAEKRNNEVKAKRLRREGYVTGNLFGKKIDGSILLKMNKTDVDKIMKSANKGSRINLDVDGTTHDVLIKEVSFNPQLARYDEIDFQELVSGEKTHSVAEVILIGHDKISEGVLQETIKEIAYKALPSAIVDKVKVDVSGMKIGDSIKVKDLDIAKDKDIDLSTDLEAVVVSLTASHMAEEVSETEAEPEVVTDSDKKTEKAEKAE